MLKKKHRLPIFLDIPDIPIFLEEKKGMKQRGAEFYTVEYNSQL